MRRVWAGWQLGDASDLAALVSFYFVLSCFPFLLVITALLAWVNRTSSTGSYAFTYWLTNYMPISARDMVLSEMAGLARDAGRYFSFGLLLTLWSASTGFLSLMEALSQIYGAKDDRSYLKKRGIAILATLVAAVFLVLSFGIWNAGHMVDEMFFQNVFSAGLQWKVLRWLATLFMISFAVDLMNYFLPQQRMPWRWVTHGSLLTALSFVVASALLGVYVNHNQNMSRVYGTLTGFIVMMLWIYLTNLSMLLGAQTDAAVNASDREKS